MDASLPNYTYITEVKDVRELNLQESLENPLLSKEGLPLFDKITAQDVKPAISSSLKQAESDFAKLEKIDQPTWQNLMLPLEVISENLVRVIGPITHLKGVRDSSELRNAWNEVEPLIVTFDLKLKQNKKIYDLVKKLSESDEFEAFDHAQKRIIKRYIQDAELSGIALEGKKKERFNQIQTELAKLQTTFQQNVIDAINEYALIITDPNDLAGLPKSFLELASQSYNQSKKESDPASTAEKGPWKLSLEPTILLGVMKYCSSEKIRKELYLASVTKASKGPHNNMAIIDQILKLRHESAQLLGFETFAELSLATKMAPNVQAVDDLLEKLRAASWKAGEKELKEIEALAASKGAKLPLNNWDITYYAERLKEKSFEFTEEEIRPYFQLPKVLEGLFQLSHKLFGISVVKAPYSVPVWNEDVTYFLVNDSSGKQISSFYIDPYSRPENKRGGAWMDICLNRHCIDQKIQLPVAYICCNMPPPIGDQPSLMTFREVETLFHEFGHALQHMLTRINYAAAAGINNVEWDAVELPSQFMENWCYHKPTLQGISAHVDTGAVIPDELFNKIASSRIFRAGSSMLRQIHFAMVDMQLHHRYEIGGAKTPFDIYQEIAKKTCHVQPLPNDYFLCSFSHIFGGGYSAGYYSYKWAEVLASDAFGAFEEVGLDNDDAIAQVGRRFRETILAEGGSRHPMEVFKQFRKREPRVEALLKQNGLL